MPANTSLFEDLAANLLFSDFSGQKMDLIRVLNCGETDFMLHWSGGLSTGTQAKPTVHCKLYLRLGTLNSYTIFISCALYGLCQDYFSLPVLYPRKGQQEGASEHCRACLVS